MTHALINLTCERWTPMAGSQHWNDEIERNGRRLRTIAADVLEMNVEGIGIRSNFYEDLGATSLEKAEILARIEREFGVTLGNGSIAVMETLDDALAAVNNSGNADADLL